MTSGFRAVRHGRGRIALTLDPIEVEVLRQLFGELLELLADAEDESRSAANADNSDGDDSDADNSDADDPLAAAVGIDLGPPAKRPDDPVLVRLFPDAYRDDPEAAAEFRRYTQGELRSRKETAARTALATLDTWGGRRVLDPDEAQAWLGALNDLRLALGERLGVTEEWPLGTGPDPFEEIIDDPDAPAAGPDEYDDLEGAAERGAGARAYAAAVYDLLTYLQESLVQSLT